MELLGRRHISCKKLLPFKSDFPKYNFKVFSISNKSSLFEAEKFLETLKDHGKCHQVPVIAVGNKNDLEYARLI